MKPLKIQASLAACLLALLCTTAIGQVPKAEEPALTRFNLDFPGGTPRELVAAIQKAMGRPLNAIIRDEFAGMELPPVKMDGVDVYQLFQALDGATRKSVAVVSSTYYGGGFSGGPSNAYQISQIIYGFRTNGRITDDSIWYFVVEKPVLPLASPEKACQFYSLAPYLERGYSVDDITTAIRTGWKMMGVTSSPEVSFHKETKLLIAVGEPDKLDVIDNVLKRLSQGKTGEKSANGQTEKSKTE